jgi:hypothetical protein
VPNDNEPPHDCLLLLEPESADRALGGKHAFNFKTCMTVEGRVTFQEGYS